jgi:restriction endonuclease S subunit
MQIVLKDIAEIFSGHTVRGRVESDPSGDVYAIQLKDLTKHYSEITDFPHQIKSTGVPKNQFLHKGDILFVSKGANNFALVFDKDYPAIAISVFFVLRITDKKVDPYYLAWYINQEKAQGYLHTGKEGTMITNITKQTLENMEIEIPPVETQKNIMEIHKLWLRELVISETILKKKSLLIQKKLIDLSHGKI